MFGKTVLGIIGYTACEGVKLFIPEYTTMATSAQTLIFQPMIGLGVAHKLERVASK